MSIASAADAASPRLKIVATDAVWVDIAHQIGGNRALTVLAKERSGAAIYSGASVLILNGAGYDSWARIALQHAQQSAKILEAADFSAAKNDHNPYVWYDIDAVRALARALAAELGSQDAAGRPFYERNLVTFDASMARLTAMITDIAHYYRGSEVFVTDNLYQRMLVSLRFKMRDDGLASGPRSGPSFVRKTAAMTNDIAERKASILIYDSETLVPAIAQLVALAKESDVPAVGVRETRPAGLSYQEWMIRQINSVHGALNEAAP